MNPPSNSSASASISRHGSTGRSSPSTHQYSIQGQTTLEADIVMTSRSLENPSEDPSLTENPASTHQPVERQRKSRYRLSVWPSRRTRVSRKVSKELSTPSDNGGSNPDQDQRSAWRRRKFASPWVGWQKSPITPVMVLQNTSSTARDHLASERTYLAYVRTSMGLAVMGVALVQLFTIAEITNPSFQFEHSKAGKVQRFARPLGGLTVAFSLVVLMQGLWRYFKIQSSLVNNKFPIARISIATTTFVFAAIIVTLFGTLLSGN